MWRNVLYSAMAKWRENGRNNGVAGGNQSAGNVSTLWRSEGKKAASALLFGMASAAKACWLAIAWHVCLTQAA